MFGRYNAFGRPFAPETAEEVNEVSTIDGMQRRIETFSHSIPTIRAAEALEYQGHFANEKDKYVWIAYQLIIQNEVIFKQLLEAVQSRGPEPIFVPKSCIDPQILEMIGTK